MRNFCLILLNKLFFWFTYVIQCLLYWIGLFIVWHHRWSVGRIADPRPRFRYVVFSFTQCDRLGICHFIIFLLRSSIGIMGISSKVVAIKLNHLETVTVWLSQRNRFIRLSIEIWFEYSWINWLVRVKCGMIIDRLAWIELVNYPE